VKIRKLSVLSIALVMVLFVACQLLISRFIVKDGFQDLEIDMAKSTVDSARRILQFKLQKLDDLVVDWAHWDDTYTFVQDLNLEYVYSNLTNETFLAQKLSTIAFWNRHGELVYAKGVDADGANDDTKAAQIAQRAHDEFSLLAKDSKEHTGVIGLGSGELLLIAMRQVLTSENAGPSQGNMLMASPITAETMGEISTLMNESVSLVSLQDGPQLTGDSPSEDIQIRLMDDDTLMSYGLIRDIEGKPLAFLRVDLKRGISHRGLAISRYYFLAVMLVLLLLSAVGYFVLNRLFLNRLESFSSQVSNFDSSSAGGKAVRIDGSDEIHDLSVTVNAMLEQIETSNAEILAKSKEALLNEEFLQQLLNSIAAGVLLVDPQTREIVDINDFALRLTGRTRGEVIGKTCHKLTCPSEVHNCPILDLHQSRDMSRRKLLTKDGSEVPIMKSVTFINKGGRELFLETFVDISEAEKARIELEEAKRELEIKVAERTAHLRSIIDTANSGIIVIDAQGLITEFSPAAEEIFGYTREEAVGQSINIFMPDPYRSEHDGYLQNFLGGGPAKVLGKLSIVPAQRKDGSQFPMEIAIKNTVVNGEPIFVAILNDVTVRMAMEEAIANEQQRLHKILETSPVGVGITVDGIARFANRSMVQMGIEVGKPSRIAYVDPRAQQKILEAIEQHGELQNFETQLLTPAGQTIDVLMYVYDFDFQDEQGVLGWAVDITERKADEEALAEALATAEEATRAKSDFLANMSHEIRTPMNAIIGLTHLALKGELNPKQRGFMEKVHRSADYLLGILNDILDFSKIEAGKLDMEKIDFFLEEVLDNLASVVGLKAQEAGLELLFDLPSDLPTALKGDPLRLGQVLLNLSNNAVKFTSQGEVVVSVRLENEDDRHVMLHFSVRDTGIGLSEAQRTKLFQKFSQADTSTTRKYGGAGLGLAISKKLTEMMGGEIWVESTEGQGSVFHFTARFERQPQAARSGGAGQGVEALHVLVMDDNATSRSVFRQMLEGFGFSVDEAASANEAIALLENQAQARDYDLAVLDWNVPGMTGVDVARSMADNPRIGNIPKVILVSAYGVEELQDSTLEVDAIAEVLNKPVMASTLFDAIMNLRGEGVRREGRIAIRKKTLGEASVKLQKAKVLLVEDNEINQDVATNLLASIGVDYRVASNGQEALDMLDRERFDGVLMDCQMPVMDGYTATRRIRQDERFKDLPIIAMTANVMAGDREKSLEAGMNDHIGKPIRHDQLLRTMGHWITPARLDEQQEPAAGAWTFGDIPGLDVEGRLKGLMGDVPLYRLLLTKFYQDYGDFEALFEASKKDPDKTAPTRCAHTLVGVAGNVGAWGVVTVAKTLEHAYREGLPDNRIKPLVRDVVQALAPIITGLAPVVGDNPIEDLPEEDFGGAESTREIAARLRRMLLESDTAALAVLEELRKAPGARANTSGLNRLAQAVNNYDFDKALEELDRMKIDQG